MPDHEPDPYDEDAFPWDCDGEYEDLGNYEEQDEEED